MEARCTYKPTAGDPHTTRGLGFVSLLMGVDSEMAFSLLLCGPVAPTYFYLLWGGGGGTLSSTPQSSQSIGESSTAAP